MDISNKIKELETENKLLKEENDKLKKQLLELVHLFYDGYDYNLN